MGVPLIVDPVTRSLIAGGERPEGWHQRWLYVGGEAAARWRSVAAAQDFRRPAGLMETMLFGTGRERARRLARAVLETAAAGPPFRTLVSLGPGDGRLDLDLARSLAGETRLHYVGVDLSEELLRGAVADLAAETDASFGILADFETRFDFVSARVRTETPAPRLYTLLGNTFGNLDVGEAVFLARVRRGLDEPDRLLLAVSTMGPGWTPEADPHGTAAGYPPPVKRFLGSGLAPVGEPTGLAAPPPHPIERFDARVRFRPGTSDVPGANAVDLEDGERNERLLAVRRYDWPALLRWLKADRGFEIVSETEVPYDEMEAAAAVLLRRTDRAGL